MSDAITAEEYVVRRGNHWLQADAHFEVTSWVPDLSRASRHTKTAAAAFIGNESRSCVAMPLAAALLQGRQGSDEEIKTTWCYRLLELVRNAGCDVSAEGFWVNAHMCCGQRLTLQQALDHMLKAFGVREESTHSQSQGATTPDGENQERPATAGETHSDR